jgi:hypothetical protein
MRYRFLAMLPLLVLALAVTGCREKPPEVGQVDGTVTVNGKPLSKLTIMFFPEPGDGRPETPITAYGASDDAGKYQLRHYFNGKDDVGVPVGWNRVTVIDQRQQHTPQGQAQPPRLISNQYANIMTTPLRFEVKPGQQTIDLKLTK